MALFGNTSAISPRDRFNQRLASAPAGGSNDPLTAMAASFGTPKFTNGVPAPKTNSNGIPNGSIPALNSLASGFKNNTPTQPGGVSISAPTKENPYGISIAPLATPGSPLSPKSGPLPPTPGPIGVLAPTTPVAGATPPNGQAVLGPNGARADLQGRNYFQNLLNSGTPDEKKSAQIWLTNHPENAGGTDPYSVGSAFGGGSGGGSPTGTPTTAPGLPDAGGGTPGGAPTPGGYADYLSREADAIKAYQDYETKIASETSGVYNQAATSDVMSGETGNIARNTALHEQGLLNAANLAGTMAGAHKPESLTYGSSLVDPVTGQSIAGGISPEDTQLLGQAISSGTITKDMLSRYSIPAILSSLKGGGNPVAAKAGANFWTSPDTQKFIANSNTAMSSLDQIKTLSSQVNRGNIQVLNNGMLKLREGVSDPAATKLVEQANILADEVGKILGSSQGSDFTIQLGQSLINPNLAPDAFNGVIDLLKGRIANKLDEYYKQGGQTAPSANGTPAGTASGAGTSSFAEAW